MLKDIERKILRIIGNYFILHKRTPSIQELEIKTGRSREGIMEVLTLLVQERYIEWSPSAPNRIVILEAWERTTYQKKYTFVYDTYGEN
ncbi:hypothetical protein GCM10023310_01200 [Paenibacillus vulneris]